MLLILFDLLCCLLEVIRLEMTGGISTKAERIFEEHLKEIKQEDKS